MTFSEELELAKNRGYKEGIEIGKLQVSKEVAKRLLEMEMEISFISEVTGLSLEEIQKLKTA